MERSKLLATATGTIGSVNKRILLTEAGASDSGVTDLLTAIKDDSAILSFTQNKTNDAGLVIFANRKSIKI